MLSPLEIRDNKFQVIFPGIELSNPIAAAKPKILRAQSAPNKKRLGKWISLVGFESQSKRTITNIQSLGCCYHLVHSLSICRISSPSILNERLLFCKGGSTNNDVAIPGVRSTLHNQSLYFVHLRMS